LNSNIDVSYYRKLKQGFDVVNEDGQLILNTELTKPALPPKSYAFCSDTAYNEAILPIIKDVDVLYHESTFLEKNEKLTLPTKHSTGKPAATNAKKAYAKTFILGYFLNS